MPQTEPLAVDMSHLCEGVIPARKRAYVYPAIALLLILSLSNIYRAATQSITHDEALTYKWFVSKPWSEIFLTYNANNHVLHSLLAKFSVTLFGLSEFTLRLPSLLGGLLYFYASYQLSSLIMRNHSLFMISVALLTLNPFILDLLIASRGYSLALAFLLYALYHLCYFLLYHQEHLLNRYKIFHLVRSSVALGVSICCNITFLTMNVGVVISFIAIYYLFYCLMNDRRPYKRHYTISITAYSCVPGVLISILILSIPLIHVKMEHFFTGSATFLGTINLLAYLSLCHHIFLNQTGNPPILSSHGLTMIPCLDFPKYFDTVDFSFIVIAFVSVGLSVLLLFFSLQRSNIIFLRSLKILIFLEFSMIICITIIFLVHKSFGLLYPSDRAAIYMIPFLTISFLYMLQILIYFNYKFSYFLIVPYTIIILVIAQFVLEFNLSYFSIWRYDASTKKIFTFLDVCHYPRARKPINLWVDWWYEPSINFYRAKYQPLWLGRIEIHMEKAREEADFDYYIFSPFNNYQSVINDKHLKVLYVDVTSGTKLASAYHDCPAAR